MGRVKKLKFPVAQICMNVFVEYKGRKLLVTKQLWDTIDHFLSIPEKS